MKPERLKVIKPFIKELSQKLNREESDILANGLYSGDFGGEVKLVYEDGSYSHYKYAFLMKNDTHGAVFTEHCGYFYFRLMDYEKIVEFGPDNKKIKAIKIKNK